MVAGYYDRRITILRPVTASRTPLNTPQKAWEPFARSWAQKTPLSDAQRIQAQQVNVSATDRFLCPWSSKLAQAAVTDQLECEGVTYALIAKPKEIGRRQQLEFTGCAQAPVNAPT